MSNFDVADFALKVACGGSNELRYDDKGMPSVMVKLPKQTWADLGIGTSTEIFPAWIINGQEVDAIYFSKYQNIVQNGRAYSIPCQDPQTTISQDSSSSRCTAKGEGWHLQTRLEWIAVAHWCKKNGTLPYGNNNNGKDSRESVYKAIPSCELNSDGKIQRVATGTGPLTWSHNRQQDGIWDMNGNVQEWVGGIRTVFGELQVISRDGITFGNDAADPDNSQGTSSPLWYAIDGTTGALIIPDGTGTTTNSLKLDWISSHWEWITGTVTDTSGKYHGCLFESITLHSSVCAKATLILQALGFYKVDTTPDAYDGDFLYAEVSRTDRRFYCGGDWSNQSGSGVFFAYGYNSSTGAMPSIGFRSAYVDMPE